MPIAEPAVRRGRRVATWLLGALVAACSAPGGDGAPPIAASPADTGVAAAVDASGAPAPLAEPAAPSAPPSPAPLSLAPLSPLADTIAQRLVFAPTVQSWFVAAGRGKRLLLDLGRVDIDLSRDPARREAFRLAAERRSPFPVGTRFVLRGGWGADTAAIRGFDAWNGRIVATLDGPARVDSVARVTEPLVASAERLREPAMADGGAAASGTPEAGPSAGPAVDSAASGGAAACDRSTDAALRERLMRLARESEDSLRASRDQPVYPRLRASLSSRRSVATGCFGAARGVAIATLYAGDYEWVRERVLLVGEQGVTRATVRDLRFRAHEALHALDADGDGVDDLAVRAWTPRGGGTAVLRLAEGGRFERLAAGFAWER